MSPTTASVYCLERVFIIQKRRIQVEPSKFPALEEIAKSLKRHSVLFSFSFGIVTAIYNVINTLF